MRTVNYCLKIQNTVERKEKLTEQKQRKASGQNRRIRKTCKSVPQKIASEVVSILYTIIFDELSTMSYRRLYI